jgi:hypothetical protein
MSKAVYIYSLIDPITDHVRYVGKTVNPTKRLSSHKLRASDLSNHKDCWIIGLRNKGYNPVMEILEVSNDLEWAFWERHYISLYKSWGFNLTNYKDGGEGGLVISSELRQKMRDRMLGTSPANKGRYFYANSKMIARTDLNNMLTGVYKSPSDAGRKTNANSSTLIATCNGQHYSHCGSRWFYYDDFIKGVDKYVPKSRTAESEELRKIKLRESIQVGVFQYDLKNNKLHEWNCIADAARSTNTAASSISECIYGKRKTANKFIWKFKN